MSIDTSDLDISLDKNHLYKEEVFTDHKAGSIRQMTPVTSDGLLDTSRTVLYVGQTQLMTPMGALPLSFEIDASSLSEALDKFPDNAKAALEKTMQELHEMRREAASSIVLPEAGGGIPGAPGGGGKIQLR